MNPRVSSVSSILLATSLLAACSGPATVASSSQPPAPVPAPAAAEALSAQIARGQAAFTARCASCHGSAGQGTVDGPPVVGPDAFPRDPRPGQKRTVAFRTAADVFAFALENMPGDAPGSIAADELLAIFAFDLKANGVELSAPLDGPSAQALVLHP